MSINVGLIGSDGHYATVTGSIREVEGAKLAAVANKNEGTLSSMGKRYAADTFVDYRDMIASGKVNVACIATVDSERGKVVKDCIDAGIHVIAEKPLCSSLEDLEAIKEAVKKNSAAHVSMLLVMRYYPCYRKVKEIVDNDEIGEVLLASAQKSYRMYYPLPDGKFRGRPDWMKSRSTFSGIIPYVGIHIADLLWWTSGREFTETMAYHANLAHTDMGEMEDTAGVLFKMDNGGSAVVRIDYHRPMTAPTHGDDRLRLAGSKGIVEVVENKVTLMNKDQAEHEVELPGAKPFFKDFVDSLDGKHEHLISKDEVIRITEICLKARESADTGKLVSLK